VASGVGGDGKQVQAAGDGEAVSAATAYRPGAAGDAGCSEGEPSPSLLHSSVHQNVCRTRASDYVAMPVWAIHTGVPPAFSLSANRGLRTKSLIAFCIGKAHIADRIRVVACAHEPLKRRGPCHGCGARSPGYLQ
jgi:hypothetical protein